MRYHMEQTGSPRTQSALCNSITKERDISNPEPLRLDIKPPKPPTKKKKWFKGYPKDPGHYWFRTDKGFMDVIRLYDFQPCCGLSSRHGTCQSDIEDDIEQDIIGWYGPIEVPEVEE